MANTIQIKRSTTAGHTPTLAAGELACNLTDGNFWIGNGVSNMLLVAPTPGADTQVLFNKAGVQGASSGLTYNYSSNTLTATNLAGSGTALTALNASNLSSGTVPAARLGSGTANTSVFLRGDQTWSNTLAGALLIAQGTLTAQAAAINTSATWNNAGVGFIHWFANVTNTASTISSQLINLQVNSVTQFYIDATGNVVSTGAMLASQFIGPGPSLTNLNASSLSSGTVPATQLGSGTPSANTFLRGDSTWTNQLALGTVTSPFQSIVVSGTFNNSGTVFAAPFEISVTNTASAAGSLLFALVASSVNKFSVDVAGNTTATGTVTGNLFSGSGASLTNLNATNLSSGLVPTARLGSNTPTTDTFLRGDQTWSNTLALGTITTSTQALNITASFGNSGVAFAAPLLVNVTNTASAVGSLLFDLQVGGVSKFNVGINGALTAAGLAGGLVGIGTGATRPTSMPAGTVYVSTDGIATSVNNGSSWLGLSPYGSSLTLPLTVANWTTINGTDITTRDYPGGGVNLQLITVVPSGSQLSGLTRPLVVTAGTYTLTAGITVLTGGFNVGIAITDGTKYILFSYSSASGNQMTVSQWATSTLGGSPTVVGGPIAFGMLAPMLYLRIVISGSTRFYQISCDGINFTLIFSESISTGTGAFLTETGGAGKGGIMIWNTTGVSLAPTVNLLHWSGA